MSANTAVARTTYHLLDRHRAALVGASTHGAHVAHIAQSLRTAQLSASRAGKPCVDCTAAA
jgi:hypothetical protein